MTTSTATNAGFAPYDATLRATCLALFDANCPAYFAPNERADYAAFLDDVGPDYLVMTDDARAVAAFGLMPGGDPQRGHLNWIMIHPDRQGAGIGRVVMGVVRTRAIAAGVGIVEIAASHLSAPFFARFGAQEIRHTQDGWGPGMHRIDMEWPVR